MVTQADDKGIHAAARLFFQLGEFDRAHDLIRKNDFDMNGKILILFALAGIAIAGNTGFKS